MIHKLKDFWKRKSEQFKVHIITTLSVFGVVGVILLFAFFPHLLGFVMPVIGLIAIYCMVYQIIKGIRE